MVDMRNVLDEMRSWNFRLLSMWIEVSYVRLLKKIGIRRDVSVIPFGVDCNEVFLKRDRQSDTLDFYTQPCPYWKKDNKTGTVACMFDGDIGHCFLLQDQCKLCNINL